MLEFKDITLINSEKDNYGLALKVAYTPYSKEIEIKQFIHDEQNGRVVIELQEFIDIYNKLVDLKLFVTKE